MASRPLKDVRHTLVVDSNEIKSCVLNALLDYHNDSQRTSDLNTKSVSFYMRDDTERLVVDVNGLTFV